MTEIKEQNVVIAAKISRSEKVTVAMISAFSGIVAAALTYSVVAILDYQNRDRELDLELARLALSIMAGEQSDNNEAAYPARRFAVDALERGTGVTIENVLKEQWAKSGEVDFGEVPSTNSLLAEDWGELIIREELRLKTCRETLVRGGMAIPEAAKSCQETYAPQGIFSR